MAWVKRHRERTLVSRHARGIQTRRTVRRCRSPCDVVEAFAPYHKQIHQLHLFRRSLAVSPWVCVRPATLTARWPYLYVMVCPGHSPHAATTDVPFLLPWNFSRQSMSRNSLEPSSSSLYHEHNKPRHGAISIAAVRKLNRQPLFLDWWKPHEGRATLWRTGSVVRPCQLYH